MTMFGITLLGENGKGKQKVNDTERAEVNRLLGKLSEEKRNTFLDYLHKLEEETDDAPNAVSAIHSKQ